MKVSVQKGATVVDEFDNIVGHCASAFVLCQLVADQGGFKDSATYSTALKAVDEATSGIEFPDELTTEFLENCIAATKAWLKTYYMEKAEHDGHAFKSGAATNYAKWDLCHCNIDFCLEYMQFLYLRCRIDGDPLSSMGTFYPSIKMQTNFDDETWQRLIASR